MYRWIGRTGLAVVTAATAYRSVPRPWHERWGASNEELAAPLPGDELIAEPASPGDARDWHRCARRAGVAVGRPARRRSGGFYSYDGLENLFGLGIHSADMIVQD